MRLQDRGALRPAVGRGHAGLGSKVGAGAHPVPHACVVGQRGVGGVHGGLQRRVGQASARTGHSTALSAGCAVAEHHGLRDRASSPRSAVSTHSGDDVAAEGGDQHVLLAAADVQEAVGVDRAEVAAWATTAARLGARRDSREQAAGDLDLAVGRHAQIAHAAARGRRCRPVGAGQVERLHRSAFGQAVALVGRNAERARLREPAWRRPRHRPRRPASASLVPAGRSASGSRPRRAASAAAG